MEVAVAGGTGVLGRRVVEEFARRGHAVRSLSRRPPVHAPARSEHHMVDLTSATGLARW